MAHQRTMISYCSNYTGHNPYTTGIQGEGERDSKGKRESERGRPFIKAKSCHFGKKLRAARRRASGPKREPKRANERPHNCTQVVYSIVGRRLQNYSVVCEHAYDNREDM